MAADLWLQEAVPLKNARLTARHPWAWVPSLYTAEGLPYVVVMTVSVVMYKGLGLSNAKIALYTSWLYLPWVIKPLWSPLVDLLRTRRWWIWVMQLVIGGALAGVALTVTASQFFRYTLAFLWLLAFSSATHDIAADGFYLLATTEKEQAFFVGIRNTFYRVATIFGQGLLVILAGLIQSHTGLPPKELQVWSSPGAALLRRIDGGLGLPPGSSADQLQILVDPPEIHIDPQSRSSAEVALLLRAAKDWNTTHHFYRPDPSAPLAGMRAAATGSWFVAVSDPLARRLQAWWGRGPAVPGQAAGNLGLTWLRLNQPPGREMVLTCAFQSGEKSFSLAEGVRLVVDDSNWKEPALIVLQMDPGLKAGSSAVFSVRSGNLPLSWKVSFLTLAGLFLGFGLWHGWILPRPPPDQPGPIGSLPAFVQGFFQTFGSFFRQPRIGLQLSFLLLYRFGEAQLVKLVTPFLLDPREAGGLGLTTAQVGWVYGTVGIGALTCGGLLGGWVASRNGLKFWLWPMVLGIHLPDAVFVYLAWAQPANLTLIGGAVAVEQFGYGFGFTALMLYMIYMARGENRTAHYAICTGFMALGMMLPGMWSGWLQNLIGYPHFFTWVILATLPSFLVTLLIPLDPEFGKR